MERIAVCTKCMHYRVRPKTQLFSRSELQASGVLKVDLEWEQQEQEWRLIERQRFESGLPFNYEPHFYAWCAACTPYDSQLMKKL